MNHEKTFSAIKKLQEVEIELHRLKNLLEIANKALGAKRTWVGLTTDDWDEIRKQVKFNFEMTTGEYAERVSHLVEAKLKEKNT